ncbi:MAG TPA: hypothetical protein DCE47_07820, partial [Planctomycetaceae bacterium]|nr:hypothetical protein [Planctomycetaceae bacterium]
GNWPGNRNRGRLGLRGRLDGEGRWRRRGREDPDDPRGPECRWDTRGFDRSPTAEHGRRDQAKDASHVMSIRSEAGKITHDCLSRPRSPGALFGRRFEPSGMTGRVVQPPLYNRLEKRRKTCL